MTDDRPTFTLYRMRFTDDTGRPATTVGVIGALEVVDEGADGVLPHERTTPKATTDRLDLTRATQANLSPVWGLSLAAGLTELLAEPAEPVGSCTDEAGVVHTVERVTDPERVAAIAAAVRAHPVLIADGHHRYAISRIYRDEERAAHGGDAGAGRADDDLRRRAGRRPAEHRRRSTACTPGTTADALLEQPRASLRPFAAGPVTRAFAAEAVRRGALCLVQPDGTGGG